MGPSASGGPAGGLKAECEPANAEALRWTSRQLWRYPPAGHLATGYCGRTDRAWDQKGRGGQWGVVLVDSSDVVDRNVKVTVEGPTLMEVAFQCNEFP